MRKIYLIVCVLFVCSVYSYAQSGSGWEWGATSGTTASSPGNQTLDIAADNSGNVYVIGRYNSAITIGGFSLPAPTGSDIFVAKYNAAGVIQWLKKHAPSTGYNEVGQVITVDADGNIYIGGTDDTPTLSGRAFLAKYDNGGNMLWNKYLTLYEVGGINLAADGNLIVLESTAATKNILKLSKTDGSTIWSVTNTNVGSNGASTYKDFTDASGNIYYTCFTTSATTVNIAGESIVTTGLTSFVASIDKDGNKRWVQPINNVQVVLGYTIDPDGNSYIIFSGGGGGSFQGYNTATLGNRYFELNNSGTVTKAAMVSPYLASRRMFRVNADGIYGFSLQQGTTTAYGASYGDYLYTVPATSTFALGNVVKYGRTTGNVLWANSFEMTGSAFVSGSMDCMTISPSGKVIVGGDYGTTVKFGASIYTASNPATYATDLFVAQFDGNNVSAPLSTNWTGNAANGNWNDAANWSNGLPDGNKKTNIPAGLSSYPTNIPSTATGGKLEIAAGVTVQLPLTFSAPAGIVNNGIIEINESTSGTFMGTLANGSKLSGTGKLVFKNEKTVIYLTQPLDQSVEINSNVAVPTYGGTINGDLILTNGMMNFVVSVYPLTVNGTVTGGSASSYVAGGVLNRKVTANGSYAFPVGTSDRYAPVSLQLKNSSGPQTISASFSKTINGSAPNTIAGGQMVTSLLNAGIWTITPDIALTAGSYTVTLSARGYTNGVADSTNYVVLKRPNSSGAWAFYGDNGISTQSGGIVTATAGNITGFSDFAIGIANGQVPVVLPVKLIRFTVQPSGNAVNLRWETSSEFNNDKFVIERSLNGSNFTAIGEAKGNGTLQAISTYQFSDNQPHNGYNYYRLKQVDADGHFEYSDVKVTQFRVQASSVVSVYPNPVSSFFNIGNAGSNVKQVMLFDLSGKNLLSLSNPQGSIQLPSTLTKGVYTVQITLTNGNVSNHKIIFLP